MTFECKYCGKVYKTEKGLLKHELGCLYKDRYDYVNNSKCFQRWLLFKTVQKIKPCKDINKEKMSLIKFPMYNCFERYSKWCDELDMIDEKSYLEFVKKFNVPITKWCDDKIYGRYSTETTK